MILHYIFEVVIIWLLITRQAKVVDIETFLTVFGFFLPP
jgi:hypothetical protein